jgi:DNA-binding winged helix-turn-helix (wHTH) protein/tetratricopeptide (TPR) repeat protein/TolB-like protein
MTTQSGQAGRTLAFSTFVFDTLTGELKRNGRRVHIPDQAARLLTALLRNPGEMVTREEIRSHLWPDGELVDYDHSIHRTVSQLRAILRDRSSKSARYIVTFPKRGYRFAAEVRQFPSALDEASEAPAPLKLVPVERVAIHAGTNEPPTAALQRAADQSPFRPSTLRRRSLIVWAGSLAAVLIVATGVGLAVIHARRQAADAHLLSLGIVPFEATGDGAEGLAESFRMDLADSLSRVPTIELRATHYFDHAGKDEDLLQSRARDLGIEALLFGKFTVVGRRCLLQLELVRSRDGVHLASLQYSGTKEELGAIRDRIEGDMFRRLHPSGQTNGTTESLTLARPTSPAAYAAYLQGRAYLVKWTDDSLRLAIGSFQQALSIEPDYARADAGMASAYFILAQHGSGDRGENLELSRRFATTAISLDPTLAEGYAMLGEVALTKDWNFTVADEDLHKATDLDPSHAIYHQWLSILYCSEGKIDLALQEIDKAHAADPEWAAPYMTEIYVADTGHLWGRAEMASTALLQRMPKWSLAHEQHAMSLWSEGKYDAAIDEWHTAALLDNNKDRAELEERGATAFRAGGVAAYARVRLQAIATRKGISHEEQDFDPAEWYAYAGEMGKAMDGVEALVKSRSTEALEVGSDPAFTSLHTNPKFVALLKSAGLPPPDPSPIAR